MRSARTIAWITVAVAPLLTGVTCGVGGEDLPENTFTVGLSADQLVPPGATAANGSATVRTVGNGLEVRGTFTNLESDLVPPEDAPVVIARAPAGENGPEAFILEVASVDRRSGTFQMNVLAEDGQIDTLQEGGYYLVIKTVGRPEGELRGQLAEEK